MNQSINPSLHKCMMNFSRGHFIDGDRDPYFAPLLTLPAPTPYYSVSRILESEILAGLPGGEAEKDWRRSEILGAMI